MSVVRRRPREVLAAELDNIAEGCLGSDTFRAEARAAAEALRRGAKTVRAGHVDYEVSDDDHDYLSTACLHGKHDYCKSATGSSADGSETWVKHPSECKFCGARCICACHKAGDE